MSLQKIGLWGACAVVLAMFGCDQPRVAVDAGRDAGTPPGMDGGDEDAGSDDDAGRTEDAGRDSGLPGDDAGADDASTSDAGPPDGGGDAGPPDAGCTPVACGPTECGVDLRDDGCGALLNCGLCGVGGGCNDDAGCRAAMECLTEAETAWTGGYCSRECRVDADCTAASHCAFRDPITLIGTCLDTCAADTDCRAGYGCRNDDEDTAGSLECVPNGSGTGAVGDRCVSHGDCGGLERGFCLSEPNGWHEGFCSLTCSPLEGCPTGTHCGFQDASGRGICLQTCADDSTCRADGYMCLNGDGDTFPLTECYPAATGTGVPGAACTGAWDCAGGAQAVCFDDDNDFRGGYCIRVGCGATSACPTGSHCGTFTFGDTDYGTCTPNCVDDTGCRSDGYACHDANGDGSTECWPAGTGTAPVGGACDGIWDCAGRENGQCVEGLGFRDGYCIVGGCTAGSCPTGSHCAGLPAAGGGTIPACVDNCSATDACRALGYGCYDVDADTVNECWSSATGAGAPGEPCLWRSDCAGGEFGFCILENGGGGNEFPGGYCVQDCAARSCPTGSFCFAAAELCLRECTSDSQCRIGDGYSCQIAEASGIMACFPAP